MNIVGDIAERKERPAYVRFERIAVEDKPASLREGRYVAKDVDMALITPPYSKDVFKSKVSDWMSSLDNDMRNGRIPERWVAEYKEAYERWKRGEEMPLKGTAIKGWGVISPAQQETLIRMSILTVEDLAGINDEGIKRIGMGAVDLKNKASAWLAQLNDKGALTQEMAAIKGENATLKASIAAMQDKLNALLAAAKSEPKEQPVQPQGININDIVDDPTPIKRGPGRPRKIT